MRRFQGDLIAPSAAISAGQIMTEIGVVERVKDARSMLTSLPSAQ